MAQVIKMIFHCKACGKAVDRLKDGICDECVKYFRDQWWINGLEQENDDEEGA